MSLWINDLVNILIQYGAIGLIIISFAESSFFPIPPDLILIPLAILKPQYALFYALITTISSVAGGLFGYFIGEKAGRPILKRFFKEDLIKKVETYFKKYGGWAVLIAALTPIPYKVFTIASGVFKIRKLTLIVASIIGRGIRFFLEGIIIDLMGENAKYIISEYFDEITIGIMSIILISYAIYRFVIKKNGNGYITSIYNTMYGKLSRIFRRRYDGVTYRISKFSFYMISGFLFATMFTVAFVYFQKDVMANQFLEFDRFLYRNLHTIKFEYILDVVKYFNMLGTLLFLLIAVLVLSMFFYAKYTTMMEMVLMVINLTGAFALNDILVNILSVFNGEYSLIDFSFYGMILYLFIVFYNKKFKAFIGVLILSAPICIGLSRIYLGIQTASGVIAGILAAGIWVVFCIMIHQVMLYYSTDRW